MNHINNYRPTPLYFIYSYTDFQTSKLTNKKSVIKLQLQLEIEHFLILKIGLQSCPYKNIRYRCFTKQKTCGINIVINYQPQISCLSNLKELLQKSIIIAYSNYYIDTNDFGWTIINLAKSLTL